MDEKDERKTKQKNKSENIAVGNTCSVYMKIKNGIHSF